MSSSPAESPSPPPASLAPGAPPAPDLPEAILHAYRSVAGRRSQASVAKAIEALGQAPASLSEPERRNIGELGWALISSKKNWGHLETLAQRGWARRLFEPSHWRDPLGQIARAGAAGYALLDILEQNGALFFDPVDSRFGSDHSALSEAARRGDKTAIDYFFPRLLAQQPMEEGQRKAYLTQFARSGLQSSKTRPLARAAILAHPLLFAQARDANGSPTLCALHCGELDLARAMMAADPSGAAQELVDLDVELLANPLATLSALEQGGFDFTTASSERSQFLLRACSNPRGQSAAAFLIERGADPRAIDKNGRSAIGLAMARWSWGDMQRFLGAEPEDARCFVGDPHNPRNLALTLAMESPSGAPAPGRHRKNEGWEARDQRLGAMWAVALASKNRPSAAALRAALQEAAACGLPGCFELLASAQGASPLSAEDLVFALDQNADSPSEAGRWACFNTARRLGADLNALIPYRDHLGGIRSDCPPLNLLTRALTNLALHDRANSHAAEAYFKRAKALMELGADLNQTTEPGKAPVWERPDFAKLPAALQEHLRALLALQEAMSLRAEIGGSAPPDLAAPAPRARAAL